VVGQCFERWNVWRLVPAADQQGASSGRRLAAQSDAVDRSSFEQAGSGSKLLLARRRETFSDWMLALTKQLARGGSY
jgi:hypothetical protein